MHAHESNHASNHSGKSIWVVDDDVKEIFVIVTFSSIGTVICLCGTVANIINMVVYLKQGFADTINISFFGLAVSDGGCLLTQLWVCICQTPQLRVTDAPVAFDQVAYVTGSIPYLCFSRISGLITTYISLERCLCIAVPLQVKRILTAKRTACIIAALFLIMIVVTIPDFTVNSVTWAYDEHRNGTILTAYFSADRAQVEDIVYAFNNVFGYFSFISIALLTAVLVAVLNSTTRWRQQSAVVDKHLSTSRDRKVVKMVVTISTVFILCYFPKTLVYFAIMVDTKFDMHGDYHNMVMMVISVAFCLETFNCSISIVIYRSMSSKYKRVLDTMCTHVQCSVRKSSKQCK